MFNNLHRYHPGFSVYLQIRRFLSMYYIHWFVIETSPFKFSHRNVTADHLRKSKRPVPGSTAASDGQGDGMLRFHDLDYGRARTEAQFPQTRDAQLWQSSSLTRGKVQHCSILLPDSDGMAARSGALCTKANYRSGRSPSVPAADNVWRKPSRFQEEQVKREKNIRSPKRKNFFHHS